MGGVDILLCLWTHLNSSYLFCACRACRAPGRGLSKGWEPDFGLLVEGRGLVFCRRSRKRAHIFAFMRLPWGRGMCVSM